MDISELVGNRYGMVVSQGFRRIFQEGCWTVSKKDDLEQRIQPASFDPVVMDCGFFVPRGFRAKRGISVLETLRTEYSYKSYVFDSVNGRIIAPDHTWLFPIDGQFSLPAGFQLRHSPKSTHGRLGNFVRLLADGSPDFDIVRGPWEGHLYWLVEPHTFHNIVFPGISFGQLRLFCGRRLKLTDEELMRVYHEHALLYYNSEPLPLSQSTIQEGVLRLTLDLEGRHTNGIVALRVKDNPDPVDLRKKGVLKVLDYYDVEMARPQDHSITVPRHGHVVLAATNESPRIPCKVTCLDGIKRGLAAQYTRYDPTSGECQLEQAGFFDPAFGFGRDGELMGASAVLEINNKEDGPLTLVHGQTAGGLEFFWTQEVPDKNYGTEIGSSYQSQVGVRPARQFAPIDFNKLSKELDKNRELVFAVDVRMLFGADYFEGFMPASNVNFLERILQRKDCRDSFVLRGPAEDDRTIKQPIAYVAIVNPSTQKIVVYTRSSDKGAYTEQKLYNKISIGVGGHVREQDAGAQNPILSSMEREISEEVVLSGRTGTFHLGYINADASGNDVDRVHFGILYITTIDNDDVKPRSPELKRGRMMSLAEARECINSPETEIWTKIAFEVVENYLRQQ